MAPPTKAPDRNTLERWRDEGYTQAEMVELTREQFGVELTRSAIANAMSRYGLSADGNRYADEVPWRVNAIHATAHPLKMLRLVGRQRAGNSMSAREAEQLESWLRSVKGQNLIVGYDPDDALGFYYIDLKYKDHDEDIPMRIKMLRMKGDATRVG
jgi:hypothetical protein